MRNDCLDTFVEYNVRLKKGIMIKKITFYLMLIVCFVSSAERNDLLVGEGLRGLVNADNPYVFCPWHRQVSRDSKWYKFKVEFYEMMLIRDEPKTYHIIMAKCDPIDKSDIKLMWLYRDDWVDGAMYKRLSLSNGDYLICYKVINGKPIVESIKKAD